MSLAFTIENILNKERNDCGDSEKLCLIRQYINREKKLKREPSACFHCEKLIENNILTVAGVSYHKECFILLATAAAVTPMRKAMTETVDAFTQFLELWNDIDIESGAAGHLQKERITYGYIKQVMGYLQGSCLVKAVKRQATQAEPKKEGEGKS